MKLNPLCAALAAFVAGCGGGGGDAAPEAVVPAAVVVAPTVLPAAPLPLPPLPTPELLPTSPSHVQAPSPVPVVAAASPPVLKVFLFLGQSNMVGLTKVEELPSALRVSTNALAFHDDVWQAYTPGMPLSKCNNSSAPPPCVGPEASFVATHPDVGIVKFAVSGTSLAKDWMPLLLSQAIAKAQAAAVNRPVEFAGAFWMQGESDAAVPEAASAYASNLRALVGRLRSELNAPSMPFTVCRINTSSTTVEVRPGVTASWPFTSTVRAAQANPGIDNYKMLDCDGLQIGHDNLHFTTAGIVQMGELFAGVVE